MNNLYTAVLLTVFNRRDITIQGLKSLYSSLSKMPETYVFDIYMVDDGCNDGTSEAVFQQFPDVHIIKGSGHLYWCRGMNLAWHSATNNKEYDFYLWFNDDSLLYDESILHLFEIERKFNNQVIACGAFEDENHAISYGVKDKHTRLIPIGSEQDVYYMNGNLVLIPRSVFSSVGYLDEIFTHGQGDYDYGLRALKKGFKIIPSEKYVGMASRHDKESRVYFEPGIPLCKRFNLLYSIKNSPIPIFKFHLRHRGLVFATYKFIRINIATLFPSFYHYLRREKKGK